jgi:hypothetical protein
MTELEGPCLKLLEGVLKHLYFFDLCDTSDEIAVVINKIFFCQSKLEVMSSYMVLDFTKIVKDTKAEVSTTNRYIQKLNKWSVVSEMLIKVESLIKGELPSTPKLEVSSSIKMTKEQSFSNLINYIKSYKHDLSVYDFATILDLFLYYMSTIKDTEYEYIGEVCVNLVYSVKIKKVYIPSHLKVLKRVEYLWSSITKSEAYTKTKKNRIFECFKTIEDVNKFFYYMVFAINSKSTLIKEEYDCLYMYDTWDLNKIHPLIEVKDPPTNFSILELL